MILEGEQRQAHVGEDEVLSQEVKDLKELPTQKQNTLAVNIFYHYIMLESETQKYSNYL